MLSRAGFLSNPALFLCCKHYTPKFSICQEFFINYFLKFHCKQVTAIYCFTLLTNSVVFAECKKEDKPRSSSSLRVEFWLFGSAEQDFHEVPFAVENTDDENRFAFDSIKRDIVAADKETIIRVDFDDRGKRRTDLGKIRERSDAVQNV